MDNTNIDPLDNYISRKYRDNRGKTLRYGRYTQTDTFIKYDEHIVKSYFSFKNNIKSIFSLSSSNKKHYVKSISFAGGGYNCAYHLGVLKYLFEHNDIDIINYDNMSFLGASGGAGIALIAKMYIDKYSRHDVLSNIIEDLIEMETLDLKLHEQVEYYSKMLFKYIDGYSDKEITQNINSKLSISLTDITDYIPKNVLISKFDDKEHLQEVIKASACVPILLDNDIREIKGRCYVDGGITNNIPCVDKKTTIRVSCMNYPLIDADVITKSYLPAMYTCFVHPGKDRILEMIQEGYDDFSEYIMKQKIE